MTWLPSWKLLQSNKNWLNMQAVILAAGRGLRLRPLTDKTPKTMIKVGDKPIIDHIFNALPDNIEEIFIIVGHLGEQIKNHVGDSWNEKPIQYVEQVDLTGTGSALHLIKDQLHDKFLVINGDDLYTKTDLEQLSQQTPAMLAFETKGPAPSTIEINEQDQMTGIRANPKEDETILRNTGAYCLDQRFFDYPLHEITVHDKTEYSLPHTFLNLAQDIPVQVVRATKWLPVGNPGELGQARNKTLTS